MRSQALTLESPDCTRSCIRKQFRESEDRPTYRQRARAGRTDAHGLALSGLSNDDTFLTVRECPRTWSIGMKKLLLGASIAAFLPSLASAQTPSDDDIVSVGTRIGDSATSSLTSPVSVITEDDIQDRGQSYISDLLRTLPGVSVNSSGSAGGLTQIRMRGTEASHVLVLIDGIEVANPTAGEFDFAGLRAEDIVRIETLRGEQSALYGSDAIGGVINIITRAGETRESYSASGEGGTYNTLEGQVSAVVPIGGATLSINGNAFTTDGYDVSGLGGEKDGSESRSLNIGLNNVELGGIALSAKGGTSRLDTEFDSDSDFNGRLDNTDGQSTIKTKIGRIDARFEIAGFGNLVTLSALETQTDTNGSFGNASTGKRTNLNWAAEREFGAHAITVLGETERESYEITPSFAATPTSPENETYAIAGDYRYTGEALSLTGSVRQDFNDRFDDAFTWRAGAGYAFENFGGRLRASVGKGVKNPSLIELFGFYPESNFVGNPDLTPEKSIGYSVGYDQELGHFDVSVDYFRSDLEDEIFTDFSGFPFLPRNRATDSKREGVELEARFDNGGPVSARASATFLDTEENGVKEIRRPELLASGTLTWAVTDTLSVTGSADHTGKQTDTDFGTFSAVTLDAFTLVGLNASYGLNDVVTLSLRGQNLLDEDYQEVFGYASQGRTVFFGVRASFD